MCRPPDRLPTGMPPAEGSTTITESFVTKFATHPYSNMLALDHTNTDDVQAPVTVSQHAQTEAPTHKKRRVRRAKPDDKRNHEQPTHCYA
ncbi:unnamed protein product [Penicillium viridicatum]